MSNKSIDKLAEQSELERLKAVNAELLEALLEVLETLSFPRLHEARTKRTPEMARERAEAAIRKAEGR